MKTSYDFTECQFLSGDPWKACIQNSSNDYQCIPFGIDSYVNHWVNFSISVGFYSCIDGCLELGLRVRCTNGKSELPPIRICLA